MCPEGRDSPHIYEQLPKSLDESYTAEKVGKVKHGLPKKGFWANLAPGRVPNKNRWEEKERGGGGMTAICSTFRVSLPPSVFPSAMDATNGSLYSWQGCKKVWRRERGRHVYAFLGGDAQKSDFIWIDPKKLPGLVSYLTGHAVRTRM